MTRRPAVAVALASALLAGALAAAQPARAENVPGSLGAPEAMLAVAPDGTPRVAFATPAGALVVAARAADGTWTDQTLPPLPGPRVLVVGLAVTPSGATDVLAEDPGARWLALGEQQADGTWLLRTVATAPKKGLLGFGGLALDTAGRPLVAYAYALRSQATYLRLVHETAAGRLVGERVTRAGFPPSSVLPAAAPVVMPSGAVRVVEAYDAATIEWARTKNHKDWIGQLVYGTSLGTPAGEVRAAAAGGGVWSAWTELFPSFDQSELLLTQHLDGERTTVLNDHAFLVSLAVPPTGPEVAGDDYVMLGTTTVYAGLIVDAAGDTLELDGNLRGYAVDAAGGRQYLIGEPDGLDWYRAPTPPAEHVALSVAVSGASFDLSGAVLGPNGAPAAGSVELWRETATGPQLLTTLPLAADGTFSTVDDPPVRPLTYRAVYVDPASGLPIASLYRSVLGG